MAQAPWEAIVAILLAIISGILWLARRTWMRLQKERRMLRDLWVFNFGTEEIDMRGLEADTVEKRLERRSYKHDWMVDAMRSIKDDQRRIAETQEMLADDKDVEPADIGDIPEWDPGRYKDEF